MSCQDDIKKLIVAYTRRKHELEMQRALAGYSVDPKVSLEIEDIEARIGNLLLELNDLGEEVDLPHSIGVEKINSVTSDFLNEILTVFLASIHKRGELLKKFYIWEQVVSPKLDDVDRKRVSKLEEIIDFITEHGAGNLHYQDIRVIAR